MGAAGPGSLAAGGPIYFRLDPEAGLLEGETAWTPR